MMLNLVVVIVLACFTPAAREGDLGFDHVEIPLLLRAGA
jgi:hypothetical protein